MIVFCVWSCAPIGDTPHLLSIYSTENKAEEVVRQLHAADDYTDYWYTAMEVLE